MEISDPGSGAAEAERMQELASTAPQTSAPMTAPEREERKQKCDV